MIEFLRAAKLATYASQGDAASVPALLSGSKQLEYRQGEWLYRDVYFGMFRFAGQEVVYCQSEPVWSMTYSGGLTPDHGHDQAAARFMPSFGRHFYKHQIPCHCVGLAH